MTAKSYVFSIRLIAKGRERSQTKVIYSPCMFLNSEIARKWTIIGLVIAGLTSLSQAKGLAMAQTIVKNVFLINGNGRFAIQKLLVTEILVLTRGWIIFFLPLFVFVAKRSRYIVFNRLGDVFLLCYAEHHFFSSAKTLQQVLFVICPPPLPTPCELTKFLLFCSSIRGHKTNINT